jgi:type III secretion protein L
MLRLNHSGVTMTPTSPVLKRSEYAAVIDAQGIIAAAEEEAALIREEAKAEFERQRQEGRKQGLEEGKAEIAEHIVTCMSQSAAYFSKVEDVMVEVVMRALRRVLGTFDRKDVVEQVVKQALESTRNEGHITVRVPPDQADHLKARVDTILGVFPKVQFLQVLPDSRLPEDGCVLETEIGVVDATIETQLKAIEKALIRSLK